MIDDAQILTALLRLPKSIQADLASVFEQLHQAHYTGPTTLHWKHGVPRTMQVPSPEIRLTAPDPVADFLDPTPVLANRA